VKKLQNVPRLSSVGAPPDAARTLAALAGAVYAAVLDPAYLLVAEDPRLLSKHNYAAAGNLFERSSLVISSDPPGTNFQGGFASFQETARALRQRTVGEPLPPAGEAPSPARVEAPPADERSGLPAPLPPAIWYSAREGASWRCTPPSPMAAADMSMTWQAASFLFWKRARRSLSSRSKP